MRESDERLLADDHRINDSRRTKRGASDVYVTATKRLCLLCTTVSVRPGQAFKNLDCCYLLGLKRNGGRNYYYYDFIINR